MDYTPNHQESETDIKNQAQMNTSDGEVKAYYTKTEYKGNVAKVKGNYNGAAALAIIATIIAVFLLAFTSAYMRNAQSEKDALTAQNGTLANALENTYRNNYYQLSDSVDNMEINLSKLIVSNGISTQGELLGKLQAEANVAGSSICQLPIKEVHLHKTVKYINQVSDYSSTLVKKLTNGEAVTATDKENLNSLYSILLKLKSSIQTMGEDIKNVKFTDSLSIDNVDEFSVSLQEMEETIFDYPKLIYDGPFSDSAEKSGKIAIGGGEVSQDQAKKKLAGYMKDMSVTSVEFNQKLTNKGIGVYVFNLKTEIGTLEAHITQTGGYLMQLNGYGYSEGSKVDAAYCLDKAESYANAIGYDVTPVWVSQTVDDYIYVNLCPVVNGIIIYPDLVKITLNVNGGAIVGVEGFSYLTNHTENRNLSYISNTEKAVKLIDGSLKLLNTAIALIPKNDREILCYEFKCTDNKNQYFVYVDANKFTEVDILRVITGTEGYTVM
ncbi:MAG: germination protein YpeB [Clostridia bacterium]|nr:germination protein YpeB [Clostridia bacterium]